MSKIKYTVKDQLGNWVTYENDCHSDTTFIELIKTLGLAFLYVIRWLIMLGVLGALFFGFLCLFD